MLLRRFSIALVLSAVLGSASATAAAASGWSIQKTPNPTGARGSGLSGVSCTSNSACTSVGSYTKGKVSVTLAERWNGTKWSLQKPPNPGHTHSGLRGALQGVSCTSRSACTAVGYYIKDTTYMTLAERWNGSKWSLQKTPNPAGGGDSFLYGVACASKSACTAVGVGATSSGTKMMLAERWNGSKWSIQKTPYPAHGEGGGLDGVSCASKGACTAVGFYYKRTNAGTLTLPLAERWNGSRWSPQKTPNPAGAAVSELYGASCASKSACTAVGDDQNASGYATLAERWNGTKWSIQKIPNPAGGTFEELYGVSCASKSACTAVGDYFSSTGTPTLAERWNGTKWSIQKTPNPSVKYSSLNGVACASKRACTAVGGYGRTLAERWSGV